MVLIFRKFVPCNLILVNNAFQGLLFFVEDIMAKNVEVILGHLQNIWTIMEHTC